MKQYKFAWEHCKNPFIFKKDYGQNILLSLEDVENVEENQLEIQKPDYTDDNEDHEMDTSIVFTPLGLMPITEHTDMFKIFDFWMCHTNFNISKNIFNIICSVPGVEAAHVFTRYRFRIAVGKVFESVPTRLKIEAAIKKYLESRINKTE